MEPLRCERKAHINLLGRFAPAKLRENKVFVKYVIIELTLKRFQWIFLEKLYENNVIYAEIAVAPYIGAWIEIITLATVSSSARSRTLYRCVD